MIPIVDHMEENGHPAWEEIAHRTDPSPTQAHGHRWGPPPISMSKEQEEKGSYPQLPLLLGTPAATAL